MQIVIDIPEQMYLNAKANTLCGGDIIVKAIKNGTPLPDGAEILTKEAYSDLCTRAAEQPEKRTEERTETHACDCISRQAARNALLNKGQHSKRYKLGETWELNLMEIEETLGELPSVEPERNLGHWIPRNSFLVPYKCSECNYESEKYDNYCPNCGSRMEVNG